MSRTNSEIIHYEPKGEDTKEKWLELFKLYKITGRTQKQVAEDNGISQSYMAKVVKWCEQKALEKGDTDLYKNITLTRLETGLDKMNIITERLMKATSKLTLEDKEGNVIESDADVALLRDSTAIRNLTTLLREVRNTNESIGKLMGVMSAHENASPAQVVVNMPNIGRGEGIKSIN